VPPRTKRLLAAIGRVTHAAVVVHGRFGLGCCPQRPSSLLAKNGTGGDQSDALRSASSVNEARMGHESRVQMIGPGLVGQMTIFVWGVKCAHKHDNAARLTAVAILASGRAVAQASTAAASAAWCWLVATEDAVIASQVPPPPVFSSWFSSAGHRPGQNRSRLL